ncbi:AMP-binding protein [Vibrio navarrensis]
MNTILTALEQRALTRPEQLAFIGHNAKGQAISLSYFALWQSVVEIAEQFIALDVQRIALRAENSLDWVVVDLAAMLADVVIVPVPMFFSAEQVAHLLSQSCPDLLIGEWFFGADQRIDALGKLQPAGELSNLPIFSLSSAHSANLLRSTRKITFTSGSTGTPKGVCLSDDNLVRVSEAIAAELGSEFRQHLVVLPLSTLLENITGVYVPILLGVTSLIYAGREVGLNGSSQFSPHAFAAALGRLQPSSLVLTPALLMALIAVVQQAPSLASSLQWVAVGGARVAPELIDKARELGIPAFEGYGLSECGSVVSMNTATNNKPGSCGKVLSHLQVKVADDGELWVKGNNALGYLGEPFEDVWLATGDIATMDDEGFLTISGRKKNLIISSFGRNISPEWIEAQAQVFAPGGQFVVIGDGQAYLTAVVSPHFDDIAQRVEALNRTMPDYARIAQLLVVESSAQWRDWLTANGRPKRALIEQQTAATRAQSDAALIRWPQDALPA